MIDVNKPMRIVRPDGSSVPCEMFLCGARGYTVQRMQGGRLTYHFNVFDHGGESVEGASIRLENVPEPATPKPYTLETIMPLIGKALVRRTGNLDGEMVLIAGASNNSVRSYFGTATYAELAVKNELSTDGGKTWRAAVQAEDE